MTARRARRRRRRSGGPVLELAALAAVAAVALGVLAVVAVVATVARLWPLLVAGAVVAAWWKLAGRRRAARPLSPRPSVPPPWTGPPSWPTPDLATVTADHDRLAAELATVTADRDRLAAEADGLRRRVAEAQRSAHLAWDAAASAPPRRHLAVVDGGRDGPRSALLSDPLSGARPLGGGQ